MPPTNILVADDDAVARDLLVDVDHATRVGVLRKLGPPGDYPHLTRLPSIVVHVIGRRPLPPHREVLGVHGGEDRRLAEEGPIHPRDVALIAFVAVLIRVLAEERVRALRRRESPHTPELRYI